MTNDILEELDIPHPPYRMSRPLASLASADELPSRRAESMSQEELQKEFESALPAEPKPEAMPVVEQSLEQPVTPEQIDQSVESKAEDAKHVVDSTPSPDVAAKETAKNEIEEARAAFQMSVKNKAAEYSGEKKKLGSLEEEYESAEAALKRAETEKKPQEVQRLTKLTQQYSDALEKKAADTKPASSPLVSVEPKQTPSGRLGEFGLGMKLTPEQQEAFRMAGEQEKQAQGEAKRIAERQAQEERARKEDIAFKSAVTKSQTAAIKENETREVAAKEAGSERVNMPPSPDVEAAREAAEAKNNEPEEPQPPAPERPQVGRENPLEYAAQQEEIRAKREYSTGVVRSAAEWALEKSVKNAWFSTLWPRLKSVYHRQFAERRAWHQEKAQGSLERAKQYQEEAKANAAETAWPLKKFYAWRERRWGRAVAKREALVDKYDLYRTRRVERHNELQRRVSDRYERELAPYRGKKEALEREQKAVTTVIETLSDKHKNALKLLATAEAKRGGLFGRRGKAAADRIRRDAMEIEQRIKKARKNLDKVNAPLAKANSKIAIYEGRQNRVAVTMKFSEMEGLKSGARRKRTPLPERGSAVHNTAEIAAEPVVEAGNRAAEEWSAGEFVQAWNNNGLVRIADTAAFEKYVADQQLKNKETGPVKLDRMLQLTDEHLKSIGSSRGFAKDSRFFLKNVPKK